MHTSKKPYTSPKLVIHGDLQKITLAGQNGDNLDQAFPAGTPRGKLTFS